ncbi:MAG TPA: hypothetical protein DD426_08280 [Clostridiaceae bacterium]|nr:hypothetical protein [Clostridiaceae bacterium]
MLKTLAFVLMASLAFQKVVFADMAPPPAVKFISILFFVIVGAGLIIICVVAFITIKNNIKKNANK